MSMNQLYQGMEGYYAALVAKSAALQLKRGDHAEHDGKPVTVLRVSDFGVVTFVPGHVAIESAPVEEFTRSEE